MKSIGELATSFAEARIEELSQLRFMSVYNCEVIENYFMGGMEGPMPEWCWKERKDNMCPQCSARQRHYVQMKEARSRRASLQGAILKSYKRMIAAGLTGGEA